MIEFVEAINAMNGQTQVMLGVFCFGSFVFAVLVLSVLESKWK